MNEYRAALAEFHSATAAFNALGEPQSGPVRDRLDAAVERFIRAQREKADSEENVPSA